MADPAAEPRQQMIRALEADLIGPFDGNPDSTEHLPLPPSRWYWTGFLASDHARSVDDPETDSEMDAGSDRNEEEGGVGTEREPKQKKTFAASLGLSVLLPAPKARQTLGVRASFATYVAREPQSGEET